MATLTCYGGVEEIGGNKVLLEFGERRVFFDFGKSFGRYSRFFDGVFIKDRVGRGLLDPLSLGLIPALRGLLRDDLIPALDPADLHEREIAPRGRQRKPRIQYDLAPGAVEAFWKHWQEHGGRAYRDLRREHSLPVDLVVLSHAHQDHISDLEYVNPEIPACSSRMTAFISKVLLDTGTASSGAPYVAPRAPKADGILEAAQEAGATPRPWVFLEDSPGGDDSEDVLETAASFWTHAGSRTLSTRAEPLPSGLRLHHWPVDHSLFGARGCAVETDAGWVAYTGDLRFHGSRGHLSQAFAEALARLKPAALLCEGTLLLAESETPSQRVTEAQVFENCLQEVRRARGELVVGDFAPRNVERLQSFHRIAQETGRLLVLQPKDAYLLRAMHLADPSLPDLMLDRHIGLYDDPKVRPHAWEEAVRQRYASSRCGPQQIRKAPGDHLLAFSLTDIVDLLDLQFLLGRQAGGLYLFSNSRAYDDEQMADLMRLWNWAQHLGMRVVGLQPTKADGREAIIPQPGFHASGHASEEDLVDFVRNVQPRVLVAIHTEVPQRWRDLLRGTSIRPCLPEMGRPISV